MGVVAVPCNFGLVYPLQQKGIAASAGAFADFTGCNCCRIFFLWCDLDSLRGRYTDE